MKKIDMKKTLNERAGNTEWTDENTWNVLRKIRNTKAERREYSLRRFVPAFMALLLVAGIGVAALTRTPGSPDPIRDKDLYTAQPIVTALAPGQGEGTDGLPEGDAGKAIREQIRDYYPEIADQLKPINLSSEKDGIRLELISGAVKGDETWAVYSLQDVEGRYPEAVINGYADFDYMMGDVYTGESPLLYADEKEHKYYYCVRAQYHQPVDTNDRMVTFSMPFYEATCTAKLDLLELLKEHGTTGEGILSPELEPIYTAEGEVPRESKKVLDYTKPLDIPVLDNVKLTGIGWIDGSLHIQFHNPDAHGFGDRASTNWGFGMDYDSDYWTEDLFDGASWDENGDGASDWQEEILNCTPETLEKLKPVVNMTVTDNIVDGDWEIRFPLSTICPEIEPAENEIDTEQAVREALRENYPEIADQMMPVNLSVEKDGIRLELISGLVTDQNSYVVYSLQDVEGKYDGSVLNPLGFDDGFGDEISGETTLLYADEKEHKYTYCNGSYYEKPLKKTDRMVSAHMDSFTVERVVKLDVAQLLKEHGTESEGVFSPELSPWVTRDGLIPQGKKTVLDYNRPQLNVPVVGDVMLTGVGWIDGKLHVQFHNPNTHGILGKNGQQVITNWNAWTEYDWDYWKEGLYDTAEWDENGDESIDWQEIILNCDREYLEKMNAQIQVTFVDALVDGNWEIELPLHTVCEDCVPLEITETKTREEWRTAITERVDEFLACWQEKDLDGMLAMCTAPWRNAPDQLKDILQDRELENWRVGSIVGINLPVATVECDISIKPYGAESSFRIKARQEEDGLWYFEPDGLLPEGAEAIEPPKAKDEDYILTGHSTGSIAKGDNIPDFIYRLAEFFSWWNQQNVEGMEALCLPADEKTDNANSMQYLVVGFGQPVQWKVDQLYGTPESENRGVACKVQIRLGNDELVWYPLDLVMTKAADGQWYVNPTSVNIAVYEITRPMITANEAENPAEDKQDENSIKGRVHEFLTCWQQKELDDMLAMCAEPWRSERSLLNQILDNRIPESWQVTDIKGEGWPVVTVGCEIRMQSEADAGFYLVKMKKEADGLWYFEPAGLGEGNSVYSVWFDMKDEDVILSSDETGSTVKAGEIPAFVSRINEFYTCWSKGDKEGMLALCPPDMRDTGYENFMIYLQSLPGKPLEWKIGQLYGKPEDDIRGAACEGIHLEPNNRKVMNLADIVVKKESDGQWYIIPASIDEIANSYAKTANGMAPLPEDEWHTTLSGRLDEFISCWQKKDKDGLLALCTTPWRSEWDKLNQLLENRTPKSWEIKWVKESGLPVVTVGCSISMQSEDEDGFFRFTAKKGTDGLWYFEPHKIWDTKVTVDLPYSITDKDLILTGNEKGSQAKAEEIPPFVDSITDFLTLWNKGDTKGMLALCQPSMRNDERHVATVEFMVIDGYKPIEWKIGQLYGAPEEDARGAACELTIRKKNGQEILYPVDITETKEADGQWYISYMSIEQIMSDMLQAEQKAAEEEYSSRNDPAREEIINTLNEFYSCWLNNDRDGMLTRCVPAEDNRGTQSVMDYLLEFGQLKGFYPGEIRKTDNENTRSIHGSVSLRIPKGEDLAYYIDFEMKKADDGQWYIHPDAVTLTLMNVVELQEITEDGQEARKLTWPITVSMELGTSKLDKPGPIDVSVSVTNTSGNKLIESMVLFDQTMTRIEEFGTSGLEAGETRTWSGQYTVTREQLAEGKVLFFLYFSEYNESTEEFESHTVSFYSPITRGEALAQEAVPSPAPAARSGRPVRVEMELGKEKLSGPETIDMTITVTNVSGDKLAGPVTLYDPDGNVVAEYSNEDFAVGETKEWTGKWTVTEEQLADGKVGFSVKYSDYKEGTQDVMAHKLNFSKEIRRE